MESESLGELIVRIALDTSGFRQGQEQVKQGLDETGTTADKSAKSVDGASKKTEAGIKRVGKQADDTAKKMQAGGKKGAEFFSAMKNEMIALVGITLTLKGLKDLVGGTTTRLAAMGRTANVIGIEGRELDAYQHLVMSVGGSAEEATASLQSMSDAIAKSMMIKGGGEVGSVLSKMGIQLVDAQGKMKGVIQIMQELPAGFQRLRDAGWTEPMLRQAGLMLGVSGGVFNAESLQQREYDSRYGHFYKNSPVTKSATQDAEKNQLMLTDVDQAF